MNISITIASERFSFAGLTRSCLGGHTRWICRLADYHRWHDYRIISDHGPLFLILSWAGHHVWSIPTPLAVVTYPTTVTVGSDTDNQYRQKLKEHNEQSDQSQVERIGESHNAYTHSHWQPCCKDHSDENVSEYRKQVKPLLQWTKRTGYFSSGILFAILSMSSWIFHSGCTTGFTVLLHRSAG